MLDEHERHAGFGREWLEQRFEGSEAAGRRADSDYGKWNRWLGGWGIQRLAVFDRLLLLGQGKLLPGSLHAR